MGKVFGDPLPLVGPSALFAFLALVIAGCSGVGKVSGNISYKGKAIPLGRVNFYNRTGVYFSPIVKGRYSIPNVPAGVVNISIETFRGGRSPAELAKMMKTNKVTTTPKMSKEDWSKLKTVMPLIPDSVIDEETESEADATTKPEEEAPMGMMPHAKRLRIPTRYANPGQSGLTYKVVKGDQEYNIDLEP